MRDYASDPKNYGFAQFIYNGGTIDFLINQRPEDQGYLGINYLYKLIGEAHINAMLLAGLLLIIAGLCNFFITDKNAISG